MDSMASWYLALCALSATTTGMICYRAAAIGSAIRVIDRPDGARKLHHKATPLIGGVAVLIPALIGSFFYYVTLSFAPILFVALIATSLAAVIGFIDDRIGLSPAVRISLLTSVVVAALIIDPLFVLHTLSFRIFGVNLSIPLHNFIAGPLVALMILGFVNASNMADGMNGQLLSSLALWSAFIVRYIGLDAGLPYVLVICSCLVALVFNLRGRLFTGSSGAYAASLLVAFGAIGAYRVSDGAMAAQVPVYWFWLPVLDCVRLMVARSLSGQSPFAADRNHFHHMLLKHMPPPRALLLYLVLLAAPGAAAMVSEEAASITLAICIVAYFAFIAAQREIPKLEGVNKFRRTCRFAPKIEDNASRPRN